MMSSIKYAKSRNLPPSLVRKLIANKELPATKLCSRWYIDEEEADRELKERCMANLVPSGTKINAISLLKRQAKEEFRRQL